MSTRPAAARTEIWIKRRKEDLKMLQHWADVDHPDTGEDTTTEADFQGFDPLMFKYDILSRAVSANGHGRGMRFDPTALQTTLGAAITDPAATVITVAGGTVNADFQDGSGSADGVLLQIGSELVTLTSQAGVSWTVVRGEHGTTAATHSNASPVLRLACSVPWGSIGMQGDTSAFPAPASIAIESQIEQLQLTWTSSLTDAQKKRLAKVEIWRGTSSGAETLYAEDDLDGIWTDTKVIVGQTRPLYYYKIRYRDFSGNPGTFSSEVSGRARIQIGPDPTGESGIPAACAYLQADITTGDATIPGTAYRVKFRAPTINAASIKAFEIQAYTSSTFPGDNETEIVTLYSGSDAVCVKGATTVVLTSGPGVDISGQELYLRNPAGSTSGPRPLAYRIASYDTGTKTATLRSGETIQHDGSNIRWQVGEWGSRTVWDNYFPDATNVVPGQDIIRQHQVVATALYWRVRAINEYGPATAWLYHNGSGGTTTAGSAVAVTASGIPPGQLTESTQDWSTDIVFTPSDYRTVTWGSGTITFADGTSYSIVSGTTGTLMARTFIYFDPTVSTTVLQVTTTFGSSIGLRRIQIALAQNVADTSQKAFVSTGIGSVVVNADQINCGKLSALSADLGNITAGTVTGATIRTDTGAAGHYARIQMDSTNGLISYDSSNNSRLQIPTVGDSLVLAVSDTVPGIIKFGSIFEFYAASTGSILYLVPLTNKVGSVEIGTGGNLLSPASISMNTEGLAGGGIYLKADDTVNARNASVFIDAYSSVQLQLYAFKDNTYRLEMRFEQNTPQFAFKVGGTQTAYIDANGVHGAPCLITSPMLENTVPASTTLYTVFGTQYDSTTDTVARVPVPFAGTISGLYFETGGSQPGSGTLVVTLMVNGSASALTLTVSAGAAAGTFSDTTHSVTVSAGDKISLKIQNNASGASAARRGASIKVAA